MPIEVKSKGVANLISGETNVWDYPFFLNVEPDARWIILFRKHFSLSQNVAPIFSGNVMVLSCIPANLANRYQAVKQAIEKANLEYVEVIKARRESQEKQQAEQRLTEEQKEKSAERFHSFWQFFHYRASLIRESSYTDLPAPLIVGALAVDRVPSSESELA